MSNLVSPTVTASSGEMLPSFSNEAAKISGAGLELSASSPDTQPSMRSPILSRST
jgi:hypothetical protein